MHILPAGNFFGRDSNKQGPHKSKTCSNLNKAAVGTPHKGRRNLLGQMGQYQIRKKQSNALHQQSEKKRKNIYNYNQLDKKRSKPL
jgi:hypothetical protein